MNAPAKFPAPPRPMTPERRALLIAFAEALARATVARDIAAAGSKGIDGANRHLREIL